MLVSQGPICVCKSSEMTTHMQIFEYNGTESSSLPTTCIRCDHNSLHIIPYASPLTPTLLAHKFLFSNEKALTEF